jgi:hypothetical protein
MLFRPPTSPEFIGILAGIILLAVYDNLDPFFSRVFWIASVPLLTLSVTTRQTRILQGQENVVKFMQTMEELDGKDAVERFFSSTPFTWYYFGVIKEKGFEEVDKDHALTQESCSILIKSYTLNQFVAPLMISVNPVVIFCSRAQTFFRLSAIIAFAVFYLLYIYASAAIDRTEADTILMSRASNLIAGFKVECAKEQSPSDKLLAEIDRKMALLSNVGLSVDRLTDRLATSPLHY